MMKKNEASRILLVLLLVLTISFFGIFVFKEPTITGVVIYQEEIKTLNWTFDDADDFSYDSSLINLSDGESKLIRSVAEHSWNADNFSEVYVSSALEYEPGKKIHDRIDKVEGLDGDSVNINKDNELFDITFDNGLSNGDLISIYLVSEDDDEENDDETNDISIYLCDNGTSCNEPGYGLVNFNGSRGWYNITIAGLSDTKTTFNIKPKQNTKFDYIKAIHKDTVTYPSINTSYPTSASIETKDVSIASLSSFLNFHKNELLNGQNVGYYYSTDSGNSWNAIQQNNNLLGVSIIGGKIRIRADMAANGSETPIIHDFAVSYLIQICNENWNLTYSECLSNNTQLRYYIDKNECGTIGNLPEDNDTYESCDYCKPSWECMSYGDCLLSNKKVCKEVKDNNTCFNATLLDSDKYALDYNEFNQSCIYDKKGSNYQNSSISFTANEKTIINATNSTDAILEVVANQNLNNKLVSITKHNENLKNTSPEAAALGKYLDIIADNGILGNITSVKIKIYYTDEEINNANLDEETLKIHYFNDTSNQWQILNSTVNTTGNYVEVTIEHLSTFGVFGEEKEIQSSESSGSSSGGRGVGGGGGGGKARIIKKAEDTKEVKVAVETKETTQLRDETKAQEEAKQECDYKISVSMPEHVSFVEQDHIKGIIYNRGNCKIENLKIDISPELKGMVGIENDEISDINFNESAEFLLIKKFEANKTSDLLIQGFNIKIPGQNVKTYNGVLTFGAIANEQLAFEEKVNVKIDLLESASIISAIGSKAAIFFITSMLFAVIFFVIYLNFFRKTREKLTPEQTYKMEEKVERTKRKSDGKR